MMFRMNGVGHVFSDRGPQALVRAILGFALLILLSSSCQHLPPPPALSYDRDSAPLFLCRYWPYGPSLARPGVAPVPDYRGWTGERMERDVRRLRAAGFDVVLISLSLDDAADSFKRERARVFVERLAADAVPLQAAFMLGGGGAPKPTDRAAAVDFVRWYVAAQLGESRASFRTNGKPLLVLAPDFSGSTLMHPALTIRKTGGSGTKWEWVSAAAGTPSGGLSSTGQIAVRAGTSPGAGSPNVPVEEWPLPRRGGDTLRAGLRHAFAKRARLICIDSWNDYAAGSFLEPNSVDGSRVLDAFKEERLRLRRHLAEQSQP